LVQKYEKKTYAEALTGTENPNRYWSGLKIKLKQEGFQLYDFIVQLKLVIKG
jgi:hypothetical protein